MPIFDVFCDESYSQQSTADSGPHVFAVGGYVAYRQDWAGFDDQWRTALEPYEIDSFHMAEYEAQRNAPYTDTTKDWPALFRELTGIIARHEIQPFVTFSEYDGYIQAKLKSVLMQTLFRYTVYNTTAMYLSVNLADGTPMTEHDRFVYVCDRVDSDIARQCVTWFERAKESEAFGRKLGSAHFCDTRKYPALQAADILVYDVMKNARNELIGIQHDRFSTRRLTEKRDIHRWQLRYPSNDWASYLKLRS